MIRIRHVMCGLPVPHHSQVLLRETQQRVRHTATPSGSRSRPTDHLVHAYHLPIQVCLPRGKDIGVTDAVTRHAGCRTSEVDGFVSANLAWQLMAPLARDAGQIHGARRIVGAVPTRTGIHALLNLMDVPVTRRALQLGRLLE